MTDSQDLERIRAERNHLIDVCVRLAAPLSWTSMGTVHSAEHLITSYVQQIEERAGRQGLEEMQAEVREVNEANGWFDSERTFGEDVALLHTEVSEMFEAYRSDGYTDMTTQLPCDCPVSTAKVRGMHHTMECAIFKPTKPEGVGSEVADVFIRLLDTCSRRGIDLRAEYERKIAYNRTRGHRHGGKRV